MAFRGIVDGGGRAIAVVNRPAAWRWLGPAGVAFLFAIALTVVVGRGDAYAFRLAIHPGAFFARPGTLLQGQTAEPTSGYDGQFTFYLAEDPFLTRPATAASLDSSYRYRRIVVPVLAWLLSLGQRNLVPYALVLVNLSAFVLLTAVMAAAAGRAGRTPWAALAVTLYAGGWIPVLWDLTDTMASALIGLGLLVDSAGLLLVATLTKETAAAVLLSRAVLAALRRDWRRAGAAGLAMGVFATWALAVWLILPGILANPANFLDRRDDLGFALTHSSVANLGVMGPVLLICGLALIRPLFGRRDDAAVAAALSAAIVLAASNSVWLDGLDYYRDTLPTVVLVFVSWCRSGDRLGAVAVVVTLVSGLTAIAGATFVIFH